MKNILLTIIQKICNKSRRRREKVFNDESIHESNKNVIDNFRKKEQDMSGGLKMFNKLVAEYNSTNLCTLGDDDVESGSIFRQMIIDSVKDALQKGEGKLVLDFEGVVGFTNPIMNSAFADLRDYLKKWKEEVKDTDLKERIQRVIDVVGFKEFLEVKADNEYGTQILINDIRRIIG